MGIDVETTVADPLLPVSDMELMFIEKASIQSAGESPILTWTGVLAVGVGLGLFELLPAPPPHPASVATRIKARHEVVTFSNFRHKKH
jgi:hypothetical protein